MEKEVPNAETPRPKAQTVQSKSADPNIIAIADAVLEYKISAFTHKKYGIVSIEVKKNPIPERHDDTIYSEISFRIKEIDMTIKDFNLNKIVSNEDIVEYWDYDNNQWNATSILSPAISEANRERIKEIYSDVASAALKSIKNEFINVDRKIGALLDRIDN